MCCAACTLESHCTIHTFTCSVKLSNSLRMLKVCSKKRLTSGPLTLSEVSITMARSRILCSSLYSSGSMKGMLPYMSMPKV